MSILRRVKSEVLGRLAESPIVALLGARQVGKTTLSRQIEADWVGPVHRFDLEDPADEARLAEPGLALRPLQGLVVLDEVQRSPGLFPLLRVMADRDPLPARFLLLGSSSPSLVRGASETLAGRVSFVFLEGFGLDEVGAGALDHLWVRGGFPRSFLAQDDEASLRWRRDFVSTFVERDLPQLAMGVAGTTMRRFWTMLAHTHGQVLNLSLLGRALGVSDTSVRAYVDNLAGTFAVSLLQPWHENVGKRQVKRPKVYLSDTGILHALLGLRTRGEIEGHPILGMSWEGFALRQVVAALRARPEECAFWATHAGAELDLLVVRGGRRLGFEFKRTDSPQRTRSMHVARATLRLDGLFVVHAGEHSFPLGEGVQATSIRRVFEEIGPLG